MIEVVWEYTAQEQHRGQLELAFGPGGAWSNVFADCPGFKGAALLRDTKNPNKYMMIEIWKTVDQREEALNEKADEWLKLEDSLQTWTESIRKVGVYRLMGEASVRSQGRFKAIHRRK